MKLTFYISVLLLSSVFILSGCDSPTDSKATAISAPSLVSPHDQDTSVPVTPTFQWDGTADKLQVAKSSAFNGYSFAVSGTSFTFPGSLEHSTFSFWRVGSTQNGTLYWSEKVFTFKTVN